MHPFLPVLVLIGMVASAIGWGTLLLKAVGVQRTLEAPTALAWAFALGTGVTGWVLYFPGVTGMMRPEVLWGVLATGLAGLWFTRPPRLIVPQKRHLVEWLLIATLIGLFAIDVCASWAPQADGDTTAYHLALPKQYLAEGKVFFTPRAIDGAVPLLLHMTYTMALGLGGETAFTLWVMATKWGAVALLFVLSREYLSRCVSLGLAAIFATLPAIVFSGLTGQVEPKMAMMLMVAVAAACHAANDRNVRFAVLAGVCIGFLVAVKYTMALPALAICAMLLVFGRSLKLPFAFGVAALLIGWQWFVFNYLASGDPVFPLLYGILPYPDTTIWSDAQHQSFRQFASDETTMPRNLWNAVLYPLLATLAPLKNFESTRIGFGPYALMVLPVALVAAWQKRQRILRHPLAPMCFVMTVSYLLWFFLGPSLRVRHFLPLLPLLLILLSVAATRLSPPVKAFVPFAIATVLTIQLGGVAIFNAKFVDYVIGVESRAEFLRNNVFRYELVEWINANLDGPGDKLLHDERQFIYFLEVDHYYANARYTGEVEVHSGVPSPAAFLAQLQRQGITHILFPTDAGWTTRTGHGLPARTASLYRNGCIDIIAELTAQRFLSRTIKNLDADEQNYAVATISDTCPASE